MTIIKPVNIKVVMAW